MSKVSRLEVEFAIPVEVTDKQYQKLAALVSEICDANVPEGCVHWASGFGSKPHFSQADAIFLGKRVEPDAPDTGEPTFDDDVFYIETCCRTAYPEELERMARKVAGK
jgi:hypothetical protein